MLKLTDREWRAFKIKHLFTLSTGANVSKTQLQKGYIPRITATDMCNGIDSYSAELDIKAYRTNRNCISISFLGSVFYQPYHASYDMKIHSLRLLKIELNQYIGLFLATELRRQFQKFSYGNQLSSSDLPQQKILLPVTSVSTPDWTFMEAYMKQKEQQILKPAIEKPCNRLTEKELIKAKMGRVNYYTHIGKSSISQMYLT